MPRVQRLHPGLSGRRRHADAQGGVLVAPLRRPITAAACLRVRTDRQGRSRGVLATRARQRPGSDAAVRAGPQARCGNDAMASTTEVRATHLSNVVRAARSVAGGAPCRPLARHVHQPLSSRSRGRGRPAPRTLGIRAYDYGMLTLARRYLLRCLDALAVELAAG